MLSGRAFRAQLVMQGQRELFDYWLHAAGERPMPARSDFDPIKVPRLLPHIGLIDFRNGLDQGLFRLAGTRLRDIYGQELTGKTVCEVFRGPSAAYWGRVHDRMARTCLPAHGVVRGPAAGRDHVVLFWLRLPLSDDGGQVDRILCLDAAGPSAAEEASQALAASHYRRVPPDPVSPTLGVQFG